ncbi:MAG: DUF3429 domain-containing protein [Candidatus Azotimanducaceae bacterium]
MSKVSSYLIVAGLIPFVSFTLCFAFGVTALPLLGSIDQVLGLYSLTIAVFIAGSHWGQHLVLDDHWTVLLPITSNITAVILWLVFLVCSFKVLIFTCVIAFMILLGIDYRLFKSGHISSQYFRMRFIVTAIVCSMLLITGVSS